MAIQKIFRIDKSENERLRIMADNKKVSENQLFRDWINSNYTCKEDIDKDRKEEKERHIAKMKDFDNLEKDLPKLEPIELNEELIKFLKSVPKKLKEGVPEINLLRYFNGASRELGTKGNYSRYQFRKLLEEYK